MLVVERTLSVLTAVAQLGGRGVGLIELGKETELSPSTLHRHVTSLLDTGYLQRQPGSKALDLGGRALALGAIWLDPASAHARVRSGVAELGEKLGETAFASQLAGDEIVCVGMQRGSNPLHLTVGLGQTIPPERAASARVILANIPREQALAVLDASPSCSDTERDALAERLEDIRDRGYDTCDDELDAGVWAVAAPVCYPDGSGVFGALAIAGPSKRFSTDLERTSAIDQTVKIASRVSELPR